MKLYHFTDTARLPWIIHDGELKPGRSRIGGFPDPDFLWATTQHQGDRTASGGTTGYRDGLTRLVRISLHVEDFTPWRQATKQHPDWTDDHVARLEASAIQAGVSRAMMEGWYCRTSPLALERVIEIETRSWANNTWKPVTLSDDVVIYAKTADGRVAAGLEIGGARFFSERVEGADGRRGYSAFRS